MQEITCLPVGALDLEPQKHCLVSADCFGYFLLHGLARSISLLECGMDFLRVLVVVVVVVVIGVLVSYLLA